MQQSATHTYSSEATGHSLTRDDRAALRQPKAAALYTAILLLAATASCSLATAQTAGVYQVTNIISDGIVPAATMDPGFVDPWGVAGTNTLWINTAVTGFSYVTSVAGAISATTKGIVPPASGTGTGSPTGIVQNTTTGFVLPAPDGVKASFIFSTGDGTISGWNSATTANHAVIAVNNSAKNAVYTDMALLTNTSGTYLLVPNFGQGADVEIYNTSFQPATLQGTFTDPNIPAGYAPYAIKVLGTQVFVTYMLRTGSTYQESLGTNTGFVSVFDVNGNYVARAVTGGNLNAPWGVAIAPAGFGIYGGDLLIGNFGDGLITAYNPTTYAYLGTIADGTGKAIAYPGLWDIFVSTATTAIPNSIYFTAGLDGETHGLFGVIANGATTSATPTFNLSTSTKVASVAVNSSTTLTLSVAPTNAFTGTVTFSCSGLPNGAACNFSSPQLAVSPNAPATELIAFATSGSYGKLQPPGLGHRALGILSAMLLPFGSLLAFRRRREYPALRGRSLRMCGALIVLFASTSLIVGCGSSASTTATPAGTSNVTINATSGSITQSTVVALTVQ